MTSESLAPGAERRLRRNVARLLFLNGSWMFLVVIPLIVPFWKSHGLSMSEVYGLQAIFAFATLSLEIPSGYFADLVGRRNAILVAAVFQGVAFSVLPLAETFWGFVLFECLAAVAVSFFSGSDIALIYESLERLGHGEETVRTMGRKLFYGQMGETLASLLGGALAVISLQLPFLVNAFTAWVPLVVALGVYEPPGGRMGRSAHAGNFRYVFDSLFRRGRFLTLVVASYMLYSAATLIAVWALQAYWLEHGVPLASFGLLWAGFNLVVALTARFAHRAERRVGLRGVVLAVAGLPVLGYLGMGLAGGWIGVVFGVAFYVCRGLNQVVLRDAINSRVPADMRASANSVAAFGMRLLFVVFGPLVGWGMDTIGIQPTLLCLAGAFVAVGLGAALPLVLSADDGEGRGLQIDHTTRDA